MGSITELSAFEIARLVASKEVSCREVTQAFLDRIDKVDPTYGSYLTVDQEGALAASEVAQSFVDRGEAGPLTGVPIAVKDNISTDGVETTCASKILKGYVPPLDRKSVV